MVGQAPANSFTLSLPCPNHRPSRLNPPHDQPIPSRPTVHHHDCK
ncbi:extensin-like [Iris pallida]|uniref:Extensin-like n=1 Tax=Iris pallida TaxID=29817 RepID=A0AAX6G0J0_IRIPA|nr:extensin-like [Iris pallida]